MSIEFDSTPNTFQMHMKKFNDTFQGTVEQWDQNQVRPTVKKTEMGLVYRVKVDDEWYFFDTGDFPGLEITSFLPRLKRGASIRGGVYQRRGRNCISWVVGDDVSMAPSNVLLWGVLCSVGFILGLGSFKLLSILMNAQEHHDGALQLLVTFGMIPLGIILMPIAVLGLLLAPFGMINALNPRKLRAMVNYRREIARRTVGAEQ